MVVNLIQAKHHPKDPKKSTLDPGNIAQRVLRFEVEDQGVHLCTIDVNDQGRVRFFTSNRQGVTFRIQDLEILVVDLKKHINILNFGGFYDRKKHGSMANAGTNISV